MSERSGVEQARGGDTSSAVAGAPRHRPARAVVALMTASALVVSAAVWLPLADVWFFSLDSGQELSRVTLRIAPMYDAWPWYVFGGGVIAALGTTIAIRDLATRRTAVIVVICWLWFSAVGLSAVVTAPGGIRPAPGECHGLPTDPADYWGSESWRHIAAAYEVAAAREPGGGVCWDIKRGPAMIITILASLVGVTAIGIAMAHIRRWRRSALAALAAGLPPAALWSIAALFQALSALE